MKHEWRTGGTFLWAIKDGALHVSDMEGKPVTKLPTQPGPVVIDELLRLAGEVARLEEMLCNFSLTGLGEITREVYLESKRALGGNGA